MPQSFRIIPSKCFCLCWELLNINWLCNSLQHVFYLSSKLILFFFFLCKNNIFTISNWVIEHFLLSTKILHDGWLALSDPKGMKVMVFLEPDPINIHFLNIWCPLSYCTLQLNAISKVTVHGSKNYRSFYYIDIQ